MISVEIKFCIYSLTEESSLYKTQYATKFDNPS